MENFTPEISSETQPNTELLVSESLRSHFYESAKWANIIAIIGMVMAVFIIIVGFFAGTFLSLLGGGLMGAMGAGSVPSALFSVVGIFYVSIGIVSFYISYVLYQFAKKSKSGILFMNQSDFEMSLDKFATYFKANGILIIVTFILAFVFAIGVGIFAASMVSNI